MRAARLAGALALGVFLATSPAAAAPQSERVEELGDQIAKRRDKVDPRVFDELGRIGGAEAFEALEDGLERLRKDPARAAAFAAFAHFKAERGLAARAVEILAGPARREEGAVALAATGSLVALGTGVAGERAVLALEAVLDLDRSDPDAKTRACDALLPLLARRGDADSLQTLLTHGSLAHTPNPDYVGAEPPPRPPAERDLGFPRSHRSVVRDVLHTLTAPPQLELLAGALAARDVSAPWKRLLIEVLSPRPDQVVTLGLAGALATDDAGVQMAALQALEGRGEWKDLEPHLRGLLKAREPGVRRAAVAAMGRHGLLDPAWRAEMLELAGSRDPATRMGATVALVEMRTEEAVAALHTLAADRNWSVRLEAWERMAELRRKESIPVLVERFAAERGRFRADVHAMLRILTGIDLGPDPERWGTWWEREGAAFVVPPYDAARAAEEKRRGDPTQRAGGTAAKSFFGVTVQSERVVFVLDISGSMRLESKGGGERTRAGVGRPSRMEVAKEQLALVLRRLPDETLFNVVFFETDVVPFSEKLVRMRKSSRAKVLRFVDEQVALGSTALYPALELAFQDELVDTIYLLSDGAPTEGEITDIAVIRQKVAEWNAHRRVRVHGITVGQDSTLLHWLTQDTGGRYLRID